MPTTAAFEEDDSLQLKDLEEGYWVSLAHKHWAKPLKTKKVKTEVLKVHLWDVLEKEDFHFRSLLVLESLQLLEKYGLGNACIGFLLIFPAIYGLATRKRQQTIMCSS